MYDVMWDVEPDNYTKTFAFRNVKNNLIKHFGNHIARDGKLYCSTLVKDKVHLSAFADGVNYQMEF